MSSAAMFAKQRGYQVAGSDKTASPMTDRLKGQGIEIFVPTGPKMSRGRTR